MASALTACGDDGPASGGAGGGDGGAPSSSNTGGAGAGSGTAGGGASSTGGNGTGGDGGDPGTGGGAVVCDEPGGPIPPLRLAEVAGGFEYPLFVTSEPADASRLYVVEQPGRIHLVEGGVAAPEPFLDISSFVQQIEYNQDERGLLGLAFHPDYAQNGRFFLYYVDSQADGLRLAEFSRSASDPNVAEPVPARVFFTITDGIQGNHNGGMLAFGPDGYLYIGVGDGGGSGDPDNHGQNTDIKLAKILRVDVDAYPTPPPGNLPGGDPDIWDYGLRNPWRFSFDTCTGDLYIGDVGQSMIEEIDVEPPGQGNRNYGWSVMEGTSCFKPGQAPGCDADSITLPVHEYDHNQGCSINGGYVYRGSAIPALRGTYLYSDFCSNRIETLTWDAGVVTAQGDLTADLESTDVLLAHSSFGEDANGELYVVDYGGTVYRIEPE